MTKHFMIILMVLFLTNQAQTQEILIYSELTSFFRGNRSANLSLQISQGKIAQAVGFDYVYDIKSPDRVLQDDKLSFGINYKVGYREPLFFEIDAILGLNLRYNRFFINQVDEYQTPFGITEEQVYQKNYHKLTPLLFVQFERNFKPFWMGLQFSLGYPFIFDVQSIPNPEYSGLGDGKTNGAKGLGSGFDLSFDIKPDFDVIMEHGYHRNMDGLVRFLAPQINLMIGYQLSK